jgi:hypothetical protein
MKNLYKSFICIIGLLSFSFVSLGQQIANLEGINYQAVAIDTEGTELVGKDVVNKPLYNKEIGVRFTITAGMNGSVYYQETHSTTTNENGLFSLNIGTGALTSSSDYSTLLDMPWINGDQWLIVEIAIGDDGNFELVSNQKFMAVPYAFYTHDIADDAITTEKILDFEILNQDISTGAVDTRVILDSTILNEDISTGAVDSRVIEDFSIMNVDLSTGAVDTRVILDSTILNEDLSTGSVDTRVIENFTILNEDMSTGSVDSRVIEDLSILNEDIADGTIDLTTKVTGVLPVENGGTGLDELISGGILIGNGTDPIQVFAPLDSGMIIAHINGVTEVYKLEAGPRMNIAYDQVNKIVTFSAIDQTGGAGLTLLGTESLNLANGAQQAYVYTMPAGSTALGDIIVPVLSQDLNEVTMTAYVSATDEITVLFFNGSGANRNLGTFDIRMINLGQ